MIDVLIIAFMLLHLYQLSNPWWRVLSMYFTGWDLTNTEMINLGWGQSVGTTWAPLQTWLNFDPSMDK